MFMFDFPIIHYPMLTILMLYFLQAISLEQKFWLSLKQSTMKIIYPLNIIVNMCKMLYISNLIFFFF